MRELIKFVADICVRFPKVADQAHDMLDECQEAIENKVSAAHAVAECYGNLMELIN